MEGCTPTISCDQIALCDTTKCPTEAVLNAATILIENYPQTSAGSALGGIAVTRQALELIRERLGCDGANVNTAGQLVCPNSELAFHTRTMAVGAWHTNQFRIPLDKIVSHNITHTGAEDRPGTYL